MKLHIFVVSYYVQQIFGEGEDKTLGPVLLQPSINVAAETQEEAVAIVRAADGFERTVTGVANGTQDVLVADAPVADSSEVDSLKASLAAMSGENEKLREVNQALESDVAAASTKITDLRAQLNQKPQTAPAQPTA